MRTQRSRLGACPRCGEEIRRHHVLIAYESDRQQCYWAECPACGEVVDPHA